MILSFISLKIHNFLSYQDAEINLQNKHYCLVSGINNSELDNAASNGTGKSTIGSAICWALTGETIQKVKSDIININPSDKDCYVELLLSVDKDLYKIRRIKSPKPDLKIEVNGTDISGKGIKESEAVLLNRLPDLTTELIASTIILGQGLPLKFTANTPSGRKELLEKLSKSDFMIQDLKDRVGARSDVLNSNLRNIEDSILQANTHKTVIEQNLQQYQAELDRLKSLTDLDDQINVIETEIINLTKSEDSAEAVYTEELTKEEDLELNLNEIKSNELNELRIEIEDFDVFRQEYLQKKSSLDASIMQLNSRICELENIRDICPTCGQKIPNIVKPSTEIEHQQLKAQQEELDNLTQKFEAAQQIFTSTKTQIASKYSDLKLELENKIKTAKLKNIELKNTLQGIGNSLQEANVKKAQLVSQKASLQDNINTLSLKIDDIRNSIKNLDNQILYNNEEKSNILERISIITQMNTFIKRDFRGYLLSDIINFINSRAKIYALDIFKNDNIEFKLNGNAIEINFCDKPFETLSGGEQQRIDLIIQFSIRDMLQEYLNFSSNILFLDEIFDQLDAIAVDAVLDCILNRLQDIESVFIISHRAGELEIPYDTQIIVIKDKAGISSLTCH